MHEWTAPIEYHKNALTVEIRIIDEDGNVVLQPDFSLSMDDLGSILQSLNHIAADKTEE